MSQLFSFTSFPYPKSESKKEILISSVLAGILIYLFLIVFQPFGTDQFQHKLKYLLLFPYSIIFGAAFLIVNLFTLKINAWNIIYELLKIAIILLLASIPFYFYNALFISHVKLNFSNYFYMVMLTFALGIPISVIYVLSRYIYLKKDHENTADKISAQLEEIESTNHSDKKTLYINAGSTQLQISEEDFLCAQSQENYCTIYYTEHNSVKKILLRISLSKLLDQIETHSIKRSHRSYIVNLVKVIQIKGNAQGYKLSVENIDFTIPVSRSFMSPTISHLKSLIE